MPPEEPRMTLVGSRSPTSPRSFFFSSRRRHTRWPRDWSSDVCSSDLAEIDEQRAVRAEAARAPGGGRAKLATLQPVACRERGALALAERRLARREPRERGNEAIQDIEPAYRGEPFPERHRAIRDRRGNGIAHIHAHTDRQPLQSLAVPTALAQDARELALPQQHVVGPFEAGLEPAEEGIDRIRDGEPDAYRDHAQLGAHRTEQHAEPDPARR